MFKCLLFQLVFSQIATLLHPTQLLFSSETYQLKRSRPHLTFVPGLNGIVKVSDEVFDDNNRKCRISSLVYRFRDYCAVAKLIRLHNESLSKKIPVLLVNLANENHEENYHKKVFFDLPQQTSDADILFFLLSSIKRRIGLDGKKTSIQLSDEFFPVNEQLRKALGLTENKHQIRYALKPTKSDDIPTYLLDKNLGEKWDIIKLERQYNVIRKIKIVECRYYVLKLLKKTLIKTLINNTPDEDYRAIVQSNLSAAAL